MDKQFLKYIVSLLLFGCNGIVASNISLSSYEIVFFRTLIGSLFLVAIFFLTKQKVTFKHNKKDLFYIILSGVAMGTSWCFLYEGYAQIGVSLASLAYCCGPVIVMALSPIIFREKLNFKRIIGFVAVIVGMVLVNGKISGNNVNIWGMFCGLMSAVTYSFMVILNKKSKNITGLENPMIQLIASFVTLTVFLLLKSGLKTDVAKTDWIWIFVLGLINTGVGCYLYFSSIGHIPAQRVAIWGYTESISAVVLAAVLLGERMTVLQIVGTILVIGGAIFAESAKRAISKNKLKINA